MMPEKFNEILMRFSGHDLDFLGIYLCQYDVIVESV
jgi:hypothetical protein